MRAEMRVGWLNILLQEIEIHWVSSLHGAGTVEPGELGANPQISSKKFLK